MESFDEEILKTENRRHTAQQAVDAINLAKQHGFENLNVDLIYGLPHQTLDGWIVLIGTATSLAPASVCAYYLRIREITPMFKWFQSKEREFPSEEEVLLMTYIDPRTRNSFGLQSIHCGLVLPR